MKILAILLILFGAIKIYQSLASNSISVADEDIPNIISKDTMVNLCKMVIGMDGIIGIICGLFIFHVL